MESNTAAVPSAAGTTRPEFARPDISVVIPAYLEEENLRILLPRVVQSLAALTNKYEIVIVDTVEPLDQTKLVCEEVGARYVNRQGGNAFGDAVRTGIRVARGQYLVFMDGDGSHSPEFIKELYPHRENFDVVIASRYVKGGCTENSSSLVFMSRVLNIIYRVVLNLNCQDVSNSFKLYKADQLKSIELRCSNFDIVEEILFKLNNRYSIKIKELPCTFRKRMFGDTKRNLLTFMVTYAWTLVRLRLGR